MAQRIFIGVAWPYANGPLHLGHLAGCYLPADIFARYHRLRGNDVLMVSGSDSHGTPITLKAEAEGIPPAQVVEKYTASFKESWEKLGISFDLFTTTMTDNHRETVHELFRALPEPRGEARRAAAAFIGAAFVLDNPWVWPIGEVFHFVGLCLLFGVVLVVNLRLLGFLQGVALADVNRLLPWAMLGLGINIVTGMLFGSAMPSPSTTLVNPGRSTPAEIMALPIMGTTIVSSTARVRPIPSPLAARCMGWSISSWTARSSPPGRTNRRLRPFGVRLGHHLEQRAPCDQHVLAEVGQGQGECSGCRRECARVAHGFLLGYSGVCKFGRPRDSGVPGDLSAAHHGEPRDGRPVTQPRRRGPLMSGKDPFERASPGGTTDTGGRGRDPVANDPDVPEADAVEH